MASASDRSSSSSSVSKHQRLSSEFVILGCNEAIEKLQLASDILLLQSTPPPPSLTAEGYPHETESASTSSVWAKESYSKSRDSIIANTKLLSILIKQLSGFLEKTHLDGVNKVVSSVANQVVFLTETATRAAYMLSVADVRCQPAKLGAVDHYQVECARQAVYMCYEKVKPQYEVFNSQERVMNISKTLADSIDKLIQECKQASENRKISRSDRAQFADCIQCLQGVTAMFSQSLKLLAATPKEESCKRCLLFGKPLLTAVDAISEFSKLPQFSGTPALLTQHGFESQTKILGGAMAIVGSTVQLLEATKSIIMLDSSSQWQKFANCAKAAAEASKLLSTSIREHVPELS